ncbi:MAG: hypothetical protein L0229_15475 [Blastocatellia bacterium]|nr:hypothetical protein [Blastocatellia bacterium]
MPNVKNRSWSSQSLSLTEGKHITLKARCCAEISEEDLNSPEIKRLIAERGIIVLPEREQGRQAPAPKQGSGGGETEGPAPAPGATEEGSHA